LQQRAGVKVIQSLGGGITTIGVEIIIAPNIDIVRKGILIGFVTKLGNGSSGVSMVRN
jgi:hypothetical protein